jgi:hypothetical protein
MLAVGGMFLVVFAIPLFLVPFEWAEAFGWEVEQTDVGPAVAVPS